jgi:branched-chain amino acid transport system substrate-binding protein
MLQAGHGHVALARLMALLLALGAALGLASCEPAPQSPRDELLVALLVVEGGGAAGMDAEYRNAAELVRRDVARLGGVATAGGRVPLRLETLTHGPGVEDGLRALRKALASGASCVIGGATSDQALPMAALAEDLHVPFISPSATAPQLTAGRQFVFRIPYSNAFQAQAAARLSREQGAVRAAVLFEQANVYSRTLATEFKRAFLDQGGARAELGGYLKVGEDSEGLLRSLLRSNPQVLFLPVYHTDAPGLVRRARALGFRGQVVGPDGWDMLRNIDMEGMIGARFLVVWSPGGEQTELSRGFLERYTSAFGHQPGSVAALVYDAFGLLFQAARQAQALDPQVLAAALRDVTDFNGVVGPGRYSMGTPERDAQVLEITSRGVLRVGTIPGLVPDKSEVK